MNKKKTIIIGLLVFVICLGIGFAAFSTTLKINGSAKVSPKADNYKVLFASSVTNVTEYSTEDFYGTPGPNTLEPSKGTFTDDTTFTNTGVTFTEDGQSIDYNFYILNAGKYDAHITNLDIGKKTCTPGEDADPALAASACSSINLSVILGDEGNQTTYTSSQAIENHVLAKGTWEQIIVRISYPEGSPLSDGELDVKWEDISLLNSSDPNYIDKNKETKNLYNISFKDNLDYDSISVDGYEDHDYFISFKKSDIYLGIAMEIENQKVIWISTGNMDTNTEIVYNNKEHKWDTEDGQIPVFENVEIISLDTLVEEGIFSENEFIEMDMELLNQIVNITKVE